MTRTTSTVLLIALLGAWIGGCDSGGPSPQPSASADRQALLALGQEWVTCLRDKGLTRMPDAEINQQGYLEFPIGDGYNWKDDLRGRSAIIDACKPIEARYPPNAFRPKEQFSAEDLRKLAEYAACMRQNGIPEFPDPDAAGVFDFSGTPLAGGIPGHVQDRAAEACEAIWSGEIRVTGAEGGKK
jgi:hypothetical protein